MTQGRREWQRSVRLLDDGEACHFLALGVVGGTPGKARLLIVFIPFGLCHGARQRQRAQKAFKISSVLTGGIAAEVKMYLGMLLVQPFQAQAEILIALLILQDGQGLGSRLSIGRRKQTR